MKDLIEELKHTAICANGCKMVHMKDVEVIIAALEELESLKSRVGELKNYADLFCEDAIVCAKINNL